MASLVEIGPVVLEKKIKMWKVYENANNNANNNDNDNNNDNNNNNDNDGQRTNFDHKSLLEPSAQLSEKMCYYSQIINNMNIN